MYHFTNFFFKFKSNLLGKSLLVECYFCHSNLGFGLTYTSCIICYQDTQIVEIFHRFRVFLSIIFCNGGGFLEIQMTLAFPHSFPLHNIFQFQSICQPFPVAQFLTQTLTQVHLHISQSELLFLLCTGCFKKSFTTLKAYRNLYRGHTQRFELSKCSKTHRVLPRIAIVQCDFHW